jgi:hypothetical protein
MKNQENAGHNPGTGEKTAQEGPNKSKPNSVAAFYKIIWATLAEIALVLWISAEFFSSIERPKFAIWLLGVSVILFFLYVSHKLLGAKVVQKYKKVVHSIFAVLCAVVIVGCCFADSFINKKLKAEHEPKVTPSEVQLNDGTNGVYSRVLVSNPSDEWIYRLTLLIQVSGNSVPIGSVKTYFSDSKVSDKFSEPNSEQRPNFVLTDAFGCDFLSPKSNGRLMILYSLAPKEIRALWILGTMSTNSFAKINLIEYTKTPFSFRVDNENNLIWEGPSTKSEFWKFFPDSEPMNFSIKVAHAAFQSNTPSTFQIEAWPPMQLFPRK